MCIQKPADGLVWLEYAVQKGEQKMMLQKADMCQVKKDYILDFVIHEESMRA